MKMVKSLMNIIKNVKTFKLNLSLNKFELKSNMIDILG